MQTLNIDTSINVYHQNVGLARGRAPSELTTVNLHIKGNQNPSLPPVLFVTQTTLLLVILSVCLKINIPSKVLS